ncbi:MAG TPA: hypothetical protein VKD72_30245, partial [Gemmataceae bacterium]|nr:hypothetical protein [Gemmataceae bacterium]
MRPVPVLMALVASAVTALCMSRRGEDTTAHEPKRKPFGIDKRVPWTTSRVKGSPEPPAPYRTEVVFPKLKFFEPLD